MEEERRGAETREGRKEEEEEVVADRDENENEEEEGFNSYRSTAVSAARRKGVFGKMTDNNVLRAEHAQDRYALTHCVRANSLSRNLKSLINSILVKRTI